MMINGTLRSRVKRDTMIVNDAFEGGGVKVQDAAVGFHVHNGWPATIFEGGRRQEVCKERARKEKARQTLLCNG